MRMLLKSALMMRSVASSVGAAEEDLKFGAEASETSVKQAKLENYRIVYFAAHGLVSGEISGLGEPALALAIPAEATELDDGLLTMSEVSKLKLDADWVVLSACNTAAGDKQGADALSGLARAFFYAGARALLTIVQRTFALWSNAEFFGTMSGISKAIPGPLWTRSDDFPSST